MPQKENDVWTLDDLRKEILYPVKSTVFKIDNWIFQGLLLAQYFTDKN